MVAQRQAALESALDKAPVSLVDAVTRTLEAGQQPLRAAFVARALNALQRLARELDDRALGEAVSSPSDYETLLRALEAPGALEALRRQDPLLAARLRGLRSREHLLTAEGEPLTTDLAAQALGITRQGVDKRRQSGRLLAVSTGRRGYLYPSWQFTAEGVLPGLEEVIALLREHDPWMQLAFFVNANTALAGETPLAELSRGNSEAVKRAARLYGEQVAV
ncbi:MAG: hypothetical protein HYY04_12650 [Chloroflexi bacterium]|nr:hypothetical protein [Chloroflexota bacterium]